MKSGSSQMTVPLFFVEDRDNGECHLLRAGGEGVGQYVHDLAVVLARLRASPHPHAPKLRTFKPTSP